MIFVRAYESPSELTVSYETLPVIINDKVDKGVWSSQPQRGI